MSFKNLFILACLLLSACSSTDKNIQHKEVENRVTRYKDTTDLEQPPTTIAMSKLKAKKREVEQVKKKGLGSAVFFDKKRSTLHVAKTFDRSWEIIDQALKLNKIKVTDKNRDQGVFYVTYDPDSQQSDDSSLMDSMTFFLFKDEYEEMDYKLTLVTQEHVTEVSAEQVIKDINDLLDDGGERMDGIMDKGSKLIEALYKTTKNDVLIK
jgi:uncharacterized lipoprotein